MGNLLVEEKEERHSRLASIAFFLVLTGFLIYTVMFTPYQNGPAIRSDGAGYHIWVHGLKFLDFRFCEYSQLLDATQSISNRDLDRGVCGIKYPPGVGLFQFPFTFIFASEDAAVSGFSESEHMAVLIIGSALLILSTFFLFRTLVLLGTSRLASTFSVASFVLGTGALHYATYDASFSHIYSFFGVSCLILIATLASQSSWTKGKLLVFFVVVLWLSLIRLTNGALSATVVAILIAQTGVSKNIRAIVLWFAAIISGAGVQLSYNFFVLGRLTLSSYGGESFSLGSPHFFDVLFSAERGLFVYYPIFLLPLILGLVFRRNVYLVALLLLITMFAALYGSWHSWFLGGGFGHRGFVDIAPFGIVSLGLSLQCVERKYIPAVSIFAFLSCFVSLTIMFYYWRGIFPFEGAEWHTIYETLQRPLLWFQFQTEQSI